MRRQRGSERKGECGAGEGAREGRGHAGEGARGGRVRGGAWRPVPKRSQRKSRKVRARSCSCAGRASGPAPLVRARARQRDFNGALPALGRARAVQQIAGGRKRRLLSVGRRARAARHAATRRARPRRAQTDPARRAGNLQQHRSVRLCLLGPYRRAALVDVKNGAETDTGRGVSQCRHHHHCHQCAASRALASPTAACAKPIAAHALTAAC